MTLLKTLLALSVSVSCSLAASLQQVTGFGTNPTGTEMFIYVPDKLASPPGLLVAIHYCTGTGPAYYSGSTYARLADIYGFVVVYPDAPDPGGCWDVHTNATLTHNAGGDSLGIASMTRYAISKYGVDTQRVFATGVSSGGMMTNVLLGAYPDLFKAGAASAGVPYACFAGEYAWSTECANGQVIKTPAQWGDLVRAGYPGFTGTRPKMQIWHGTQDQILYYQNFLEEIKQWTNVFGVSSTPATTATNTPVSAWTKTTYGDKLVAYSGEGVSHNLPLFENEVLAFFGLSDKPVNPGTPVGTIPQWGQCGGGAWTGDTVCQFPWTCNFVSEWYSQCF